MYKTLITSALAAFLFSQTPAHAQAAFVEDMVARIEAEGYVIAEIGRSWLGRIVITAYNASDLREVVLNRTSGEILRDQRFPNENAEREPPEQPAIGTGEPGNPGGPGGGGGAGHGGG